MHLVCNLLQSIRDLATLLNSWFYKKSHELAVCIKVYILGYKRFDILSEISYYQLLWIFFLLSLFFCYSLFFFFVLYLFVIIELVQLVDILVLKAYDFCLVLLQTRICRFLFYIFLILSFFVANTTMTVYIYVIIYMYMLIILSYGFSIPYWPYWNLYQWSQANRADVHFGFN